VFFFQAEDGIRDKLVTGVQTCALPIWLTFLRKLMHFHPMPAVVISSLAQTSCRIAIEALELGAVEVLAKPGGPYSVGELRHTLRSEERRVGKEGGAGGWRYRSRDKREK